MRLLDTRSVYKNEQYFLIYNQIEKKLVEEKNRKKTNIQIKQ